MPTPPGSLFFIVYAPALRGDDRRMLAIVQGMERAFPGLRLEWEVSKEGRPIALPHRNKWLAEAAARGQFPLVCNGDESYPVTIAGLETLARLVPGGQPQLEVHGDMPLDEKGFKAAAAVLEAVAEESRALWGHATPPRAGAEIALQTSRPPQGPHIPPRGLPVLKMPWDIRSPEIPQRLGWLNYWSAAAAQSIGFPDPSRDADLLSRARRTVTGGWIVRLTEEPLDLDNPEHLDVLLRTYERFPEIGGRATF